MSFTLPGFSGSALIKQSPYRSVRFATGFLLLSFFASSHQLGRGDFRERTLTGYATGRCRGKSEIHKIDRRRARGNVRDVRNASLVSSPSSPGACLRDASVCTRPSSICSLALFSLLSVRPLYKSLVNVRPGVFGICELQLGGLSIVSLKHRRVPPRRGGYI